MKLIKTLIWIALYGADTMALKKIDVWRLEVLEMWRSMLHIK